MAQVALDRLKLASVERSGGSRPAAAWSSAFLRAMCFVNKLRQPSTADQCPSSTRFLCIKIAPDDSSQYLAFMNATFAAQRAGITVDVVTLGQQHSPFMQQACHLTGGIYLHPSKPEVLVQYLMVRKIILYLI